MATERTYIRRHPETNMWGTEQTNVAVDTKILWVVDPTAGNVAPVNLITGRYELVILAKGIDFIHGDETYQIDIYHNNEDTDTETLIQSRIINIGDCSTNLSGQYEFVHIMKEWFDEEQYNEIIVYLNVGGTSPNVAQINAGITFCDKS